MHTQATEHEQLRHKRIYHTEEVEAVPVVIEEPTGACSDLDHHLGRANQQKNDGRHVNAPQGCVAAVPPRLCDPHTCTHVHTYTHTVDHTATISRVRSAMGSGAATPAAHVVCGARIELMLQAEPP